MFVPGATNPVNNGNHAPPAHTPTHTEDVHAKTGISQKFTEILQHIRNTIMKAHLAYQPTVCFDLLVFMLYTQATHSIRFNISSIDIKANPSKDEPFQISNDEIKKLDTINPAKTQLKEFEKSINLDSLNKIDANDQLALFKAFCELSIEQKNAMMAFAVAQTLQPVSLDFMDKSHARRYNPLHLYLIEKLNINWRDDLVLNNDFFNYYSKADLLHIGATITEDQEWAVQCAKMKKTELIEALVKIVDRDTISSAVNEAAKERAVTWLPDGFPAPREHSEATSNSDKDINQQHKPKPGPKEKKQSANTKDTQVRKSKTNGSADTTTPPPNNETTESLPAFLS